ncbi:hypothetical protein UT300012_31860 [Paraclostridium bifermentans]
MKDYEMAWKILKSKILDDSIDNYTNVSDKDSYTFKELLNMMDALEKQIQRMMDEYNLMQ